MIELELFAFSSLVSTPNSGIFVGGLNRNGSFYLLRAKRWKIRGGEVGRRASARRSRNIIEIPNQSGVLIHPINSGPGITGGTSRQVSGFQTCEEKNANSNVVIEMY